MLGLYRGALILLTTHGSAYYKKCFGTLNQTSPDNYGSPLSCFGQHSFCEKQSPLSRSIHLFIKWGFIFCILVNCNLLWILRKMFLRHFVLVYSNICKRLLLLGFIHWDILSWNFSKVQYIATNIILRGLTKKVLQFVLELGIYCLLSLLDYFDIVKLSLKLWELKTAQKILSKSGKIFFSVSLLYFS